MTVARKLFRLFKSFNEYVKIKDFQKGALPSFDKNLNIICRLSFLFYWIFDNLAVLVKVKFLTSLDLKSTARRASQFWLIGIILSIVIAVKGMLAAAKEEARLILSKASLKQGEEGAADRAKWGEDMKALQAKKLTNTLNVIKNLGDSITAS